MQLTHRMFSVLAALLLLAGTAQIVASQEQQPAPQQEHQQQTMQAIQGELGKVDVDRKTLTIQTSSGTEMMFSYTEETEVTGAQQGVAGLATKSGSAVTVYYTTSGDSKVAKKIEIQSSR